MATRPLGAVSLFAERQPAIALAGLAFVVLNNGLASAMVIAAYGFDLQAIAERGALIERGSAPADLLRWGGLIDMVGYLALAPVVVHLHRRLGRAAITAAGLAFTLVGAIGAAALASAGPWLLGAAASGTLPTATARAAFATLENLVVVGLWGALGQSLLGTWLIGTSWSMRPDNRALANVGFGAGVGALGYAIRTGLAGQPPLPIASPLDVAILAGIGLVPIWVTWLSLQLALGPRGR